MPKNKTAPVETIRSFFGEHQRRISFQSPIKTISLQQRVEKQRNGMDGLREEISKVIKCLLESNFPHKNIEDAVTIIEKIVEKEIDSSTKEIENYYASNTKIVYLERILNPDGSFYYYETEYPNKWYQNKWYPNKWYSNKWYSKSEFNDYC
jgi:hypothetical protein